MSKLDFVQVISSVVDEFDVPKAEFGDTALATILRIVFGIMGAVAVIILLLASLKYVTSRGEPGEVAKAKNTIIYAAVGLVIIAFAFSIVAFVVGKV
jgi:hypothetical protein